MDKFKNIFKKEPNSPVSPGQASPERLPNGTTARGSGRQENAEGFLCPICMKSFPNPDVLQHHFDSVHASDTFPQVAAEKEVELLRMQLTASEESRVLLSGELMNMQKQMQDLAFQRDKWDESTSVNSEQMQRLEERNKILEVDNSKWSQKYHDVEIKLQELQEKIFFAERDKNTVKEALSAERDKLDIVSHQLTKEQLRNQKLLEDLKSSSDQLKKSEISFEQMKISAAKADTFAAQLSGKEELCRSLETQVHELKQSITKHESRSAELQKLVESKDDHITKMQSMHSEMKSAMESKVQSMEALVTEKALNYDRVLTESEQLLHKNSLLESRLQAVQTELTEANRNYDDLHQNFIQKIEAGEGTNIIVTQLKEDSARIQEKLRHAEEKLAFEKEESYQKLRVLEAQYKKAEALLENTRTDMGKAKEMVASLELSLLSQSRDAEQKINELILGKECLEELLCATKANQTESLSAMMESKQTIITELENKITLYEQELSSVRSKLGEEESHLSIARNNIGQMTDELCAKDKEITHLEQKLHHLNAELLSATAQLAETKDTVQATAKELTSAEGKLSISSLELEATKEELKRAVQEFTAVREELVVTKHDLAVKNEELESLKEELRCNKDQFIVMREELIQTREELTLTKQQHSKTVSELDNILLELTDLKSAKESQMTELISAREEFDRQKESFTHSLSVSEGLVRDKQAALTELEKEIVSRNDQCTALTRQLQAVETQTQALVVQNASLSQQITTAIKEKHDSIQLSQETIVQLEESKNAAEALKVKLTESANIQDRLRADLQALKQQLKEREATSITLQHKLDSAIKEAEIQQKLLVDRLEKQDLSAKRSDSNRSEEIAKLKQELHEVREKVKKQTETNGALSQELATTLETLELKESQVISLRAQLGTTSAELSDMKVTLEKRMENHTHALQETTEILQRTSDENEALERTVSELKLELASVEEQLQTTQTACDDWQTKHEILLQDIDALKEALVQEKRDSEEAKQILISQKLELQNDNHELIQSNQKLTKELAEATQAKQEADERASEHLASLQMALSMEKSKMEEAEARYNMQLVSLTENLSLNKADLTATQEKLMDVVTHNDSLRALNLEIETKLDASNDDRRILWERCLASENETLKLREEKNQLKQQLDQLNGALHELGRENQSLQIKTTVVASRKWADDSEVLDCFNCTKAFSVTIRKHHCRSCGNIFCHECSSKQAGLPANKKPVRVCDACYTELTR